MLQTSSPEPNANVRGSSSWPRYRSSPSDSSGSVQHTGGNLRPSLSPHCSSNESDLPSQLDKANRSTYTRFLRRYRPSFLVEDASRNDPESVYYLTRGSGLMMARGDSSDDDTTDPPSGSSLSNYNRPPAISPDPELQPQSAEDHRRVQWQATLAGVLAGDGLNSENTPINVAVRSSVSDDRKLRADLWLGIRAKIHERPVAEEQRRLAERRLGIVDAILNQVLTFSVSDAHADLDSDADAQSPPTEYALMQVNAILRKLDIAYSLYPSMRGLYSEHPSALEAEFEARCDTLNTWSTVITSLHQQIHLLQKWTGSMTLSVTQPTIPGTPLLPDPPAIGTPFVERLLKEKAMQIRFEKISMTTIHALVSTTRAAHVDLAAMFRKMNLPAFEQELVPLVSFLMNLAQAALRLQLDYAHKLQNPDVLIIDQMTEDFGVKIGFACALKRQYQAFLKPDPGGNWRLPPCISDDYDSVILEALGFFFKLLNWKLKSSTKPIYFKETDIIETQWATFSDVSLVVPGGATLVAEQLCALTSKLTGRITNYFDLQIRTTIASGEKARQIANVIELSGNPIPPPNATNSAFQAHLQRATGTNELLTSEQLIFWYSEILEGVKQRYRKLERLSRVLTRRLGNSAEYSLAGVPMDLFIAALVNTDHCLVFTQRLEGDSTYILAPATLCDHPERIRRIFTEAFEVNEAADEQSWLMDKDEDHPPLEEESCYLLILSPRVPFIWNGRVNMLNLPILDLELADNCARLVADGPTHRLAIAKRAFNGIFTRYNKDSEPAGAAIAPLVCTIEQQAHLPSVNLELQKIGRAANRLAESIVDSVEHVRTALHVSDGYQELTQNWYVFASEHDQHIQTYMNHAPSLKFHRLLIGLAISWVSFICNDCDPNDRKTFRWAVIALEFTLNRSRRGNILQMPDEQFETLQREVASCIALLVSHFDILGTRSTLEAEKERKLRVELAKHDLVDIYDQAEDLLLDEKLSKEPTHLDNYLRLFWERTSDAVSQLEKRRSEVGMEPAGRVLDEGVADQSLVFLNGSSSDIAIRWQQGKFIGSGSFGSVYLAVNLENGSLMAVKEIKFQQAAGLSNLYNQIKDELSVMKTLHHPNVVEYFGIEVHRDKVYIFEEFCQGGSLAALLEHGRIEDESIIQVYTMQLLEGLAYLHSMDVVHRDIKPDNILLDHLGVVKYVDFGAAKILAKNQQTMRISRADTDVVMPNLGMALGTEQSLTGTPMYMSPEVIRNDRRQGRHGAMDIWSLGCVVLECATGHKPWSNLDNEWAIMFHIGVATQHPPLPDPKQLSEQGIDFIRQCLIIDPTERLTAFELTDHPWMQGFLEQLKDMEISELASIPPVEIPADIAYTNATIARHAAIEKQKEIEAIKALSPLTSPATSPMEVEDPYAF